MSAAEFMTEDGDDKLASMARDSKSRSFWRGALEGFGGPTLMGFSEPRVKHDRHLREIYTHLLRAALRRPGKASMSFEVDKEVAEAVRQAMVEALEKHGISHAVDLDFHSPSENAVRSVARRLNKLAQDDGTK